MDKHDDFLSKAGVLLQLLKPSIQQDIQATIHIPKGSFVTQ
jgi:hypothetical protein